MSLKGNEGGGGTGGSNRGGAPVVQGKKKCEGGGVFGNRNNKRREWKESRNLPGMLVFPLLTTSWQRGQQHRERPSRKGTNEWRETGMVLKVGSDSIL